MEMKEGAMLDMFTPEEVEKLYSDLNGEHNNILSKEEEKDFLNWCTEISYLEQKEKKPEKKFTVMFDPNTNKWHLEYMEGNKTKYTVDCDDDKMEQAMINDINIWEWFEV